jgi:hypothetical protein
MKLQNQTAVYLRRTAQGGLAVDRVVRNPLVATRGGKPVFGPLCRRLLTVAEVVTATGLSKNRAQEGLRSDPLAHLADWPGQEPLQVAA